MAKKKPKYGVNNSFFPTKFIFSPKILLTIKPTKKSTQLVCGTTATTYFNNFGNLPSIFHPNSFRKKNFENKRNIFLAFQIKIFGCKTYQI